MLWIPYVLAAVLATLGVLCHRFYFIHGEHHLAAPWLLALWIISTGGIALTTVFIRINVLSTVLLINTAFFIALFGSILMYRLHQHALCGFDGPRLAAVSKLWHFGHMFRVSNHLFLDALTKKYGTIIRTGPQELTITDPEVWEAVNKPGSLCIKSPWYDMLWPYVALNSIRGKEGYAVRRRRWDDALRISNESSTDKKHLINQAASQLLCRIETSLGKPFNATTEFYNFSFDLVGEIVFGQSFSLLDSHSYLSHSSPPDLISQGMSMLRYFSPVPWIGHLSFFMAPYFPMITQKWNRALGWAAEVCDLRLQRGAKCQESADAFSRFILSASRDGDQQSLDRHALYGDAFAITVAGSHSTAATLTMMFFELARRPSIQLQLRQELQTAGATIQYSHHNGARKLVDTSVFNRLPILNSCITETLRLYPVVPTGGIRQTVNKGVKVGNKWIPPNTVIVMPRWSMGRSNCAFDMPNDFVPERWTVKSHMVHDARAYNGFGAGRWICPGKQLGVMEIRILATMVILNYEFSLASTPRNETRVVDDFQDNFTATPGKLELVFNPLTHSR
ncbi:cytochrome P450 [Xylaria castorea]|nr:cytochrome P450 [Xylaria castorea]